MFFDVLERWAVSSVALFEVSLRKNFVLQGDGGNWFLLALHLRRKSSTKGKRKRMCKGKREGFFSDFETSRFLFEAILFFFLFLRICCNSLIGVTNSLNHGLSSVSF